MPRPASFFFFALFFAYLVFVGSLLFMSVGAPGTNFFVWLMVFFAGLPWSVLGFVVPGRSDSLSFVLSWGGIALNTFLLFGLAFLGRANSSAGTQHSGPAKSADWTPQLEMLTNAIIANDVSRVRLLVSRGIDVHAKNEHGVTPMQMACNCEYDEIISILEKSACRDSVD